MGTWCRAGCTLLCEALFSRVDRGAGRPPVRRLPYFPTEARQELAKYSHVIVLGCRVPVAMFGYADGISQLVDYVEQNVVEVRESIRRLLAPIWE